MRGPQIRITCPADSSSLRAKITQMDGSEFPGKYTWAGITLNWADGDPPVVDLELQAIMPEIDIAADVRHIVLDGRKYRLVEVDESGKDKL